MDSISQALLGASVAVVATGRRTAPWKAALWGGVCGTLPDLDVLIRYGDAVLDMTRHRAESHALFWLTLVTPLLAWIPSVLDRRGAGLRRWLLATWLALFTHPLLDAMTIYGTQLALPFSDHPFGVGSIFIIDPLFTLPLLIGLTVTLLRSHRRAQRQARTAAVRSGLVLCAVYLAWSVLAQAWVESTVRQSLASIHGKSARELPVLVTPTPFNTVLWRILVMHDDRYEEGFVSLLDGERPLKLTAYPRGRELHDATRELPAVQIMTRFTHGFWRMGEDARGIVLTDLRMGQEPFYSFAFRVARRDANPGLQPVVPVNVGGRREMDVRASLRWLGRRAMGADEAPPGPRQSPRN
jgi:inner membrane protein